jgi:hypothetical protein
VPCLVAVQLLRRYRQQLREQEVQLHQQNSLLDQGTARLLTYEAELQDEQQRNSELADRSSKYEAKYRDSLHRCALRYQCVPAPEGPPAADVLHPAAAHTCLP